MILRLKTRERTGRFLDTRGRLVRRNCDRRRKLSELDRRRRMARLLLTSSLLRRFGRRRYGEEARVQSSMERLASLEGRAQEQGRMVDVIRDGMAGLAGRMDSLDARMAAFETRIIGLEERIDRRFAQVDARFTEIDGRFIGIDQRFIGIDLRFTGIDERLDRMSAQLSNLIIGVAVAAISGVLGLITAMVR